MTSKAELAHQNEITRQVKKEEEAIADLAKDAVHDTKKSVEALAKKTENMEITDAPGRLLPSADKIDKKLEHLQENIKDAQHAQVHDKNVENYSKISQVLRDTDRIVQDQRDFLKDKTEDGTLMDTAQSVANLAQEIVDEGWFTLDSLWTNWTALATVLAAGSGGSWKQMLQESGRLLNDLRDTGDFVKLLTDLKNSFGNFSELILKKKPVGDKLEEANKEWDEQRDKILGDLTNIYNFLSKSPLWGQLVKQGAALKEQAKKVGEETKEQIAESADKIAHSKNLKKIKEDLVQILQLVVGKDGPSVKPFLDYSYAAWDDIMTTENYSKWASEASALFETFNSNPKTANQEEYQKQLQELYQQTKELLDNTVKNDNLRLALRESRKLIKAAKKDPATRKLIADSQKLLKDISNKKGTGLLDPTLLNEIRGLLVPVLLHHFDNAALPDFHGYDENALGKFDYHLTGIRLGTSGLIPSKVKIEFRYKTVANPSKLQIEQQHMYMYMYIDDIQLTLKDIKWSYNRHTIPRISDQGTIDITTAGKGITIRMKAEVHNYAPAHQSQSLSELLEPPKEPKMFDVAKAECTIDDWHVRVSDTNSNTFYEMLAGIWGTKIKHQVENLIETKIRILATRFDRQIYDIVRRTVQPSLTDDAKDSLFSAGKSITETLTNVATNVTANIQSL